MQRFLFILSLFGSVSSFAALPTIYCGEATANSVIFEEGIDDFILDVKEAANQGSFAAAVLGKPDGKKYRLVVRIPKTLGNQFSTPRPNCFFSETKPFLFSCQNGTISGKAKLTDESNGNVQELALSYFQASSSMMSKTSLDYAGKEVNQEIVRFSFSTYVTMPMASVARTDLDFAVKACKSGELVESPAH